MSDSSKLYIVPSSDLSQRLGKQLGRAEKVIL